MSVTQIMALMGVSSMGWDGSVEYMVIAGGGGGGSQHGGGGGAGGVIYNTGTYTAPFTLTVGSGGGYLLNGANSAAFGETAIGGGRGIGSNDFAGNGGSGGGEGGYDRTGHPATYGTGTAGQGNRGGRNGAIISSNASTGGGGGGAGAVGGNASDSSGGRAGSGGIGITNSFLNDIQYGELSGGNYYVGGGGGAGGWNGNRLEGLGGIGGGGAGGIHSTVAENGTDGLGGGAGGRQVITDGNSSFIGGTGGSGAVLIRVPNNVYLQRDSGNVMFSAPIDIAGTSDHCYVTTSGSGTVSLTDVPHEAYSLAPITQGLVVHLDAGVSTSYPGSGSTWFDLTSNNNDFTLFNSPTYSSANGGKFQFNGSTQYASGGPNLSASDCTVVTIHRYATNSNSARGRITAGASNNWLLGIHDGFMDRYYASGGWIILSSTPADTDWHIHAVTEDYSGDTRVLYDNNVAPSGQTPSGGVAGPNGIQLGKWSTTEYSDSEVAALLVYDRVLSTTELTTIYDFYKDRFGLT